MSDLKLFIRRINYWDRADKLAFFREENKEWTKVISLYRKVRDGNYEYFENLKMQRQNHDLIYFMQ